MEYTLSIVQGPPVKRLERKVASERLVETAKREAPEGTLLGELQEINGHYYVAVATPKVAGPFPPKSPQEESAPTDEAPAPPSDEGPESDESEKPEESEEKPEGKEDGEKGEKGEEHQLSQIYDMLSKITEALGLAGPDSDSEGEEAPVGPEGPEGEGPPGPPGGPEGGPPGGPEGAGPKPSTRPLKPGDAPPGATPIGAPSFASVDPNHPWAKQASDPNRKAWDVTSPVDEDESVSTIVAELNGLAQPIGCRVEQFRSNVVDGKRVATAKIVRV